MHLLMTIVSYIALLLLIMPATLTGIVRTLLLLILGTTLLIWKKPQIISCSISKSSVLNAFFPAVSLGTIFYVQWSPSSKVRLIAAVLHISAPVLLSIAAVCLSLCAVYFMSGMLQQVKKGLEELGKKHSFARDLVICFVTAVVTVCLSQVMIDTDISSMGPLKFIWGTAIVSVPILIVYCLSSDITVSTALGTISFIIISAVNVYIYRFRGRLLEPIDVFSFGTAMNVANNYSLLPIPHSIISSLGVWIGLLICISGTSHRSKQRCSAKRRIILSLCCLVIAVSGFFYTSDLKTYHWDKEGAEFNGYILDFFSKIKEAYIVEPDGYSMEHIEELSDRYTLDTAPPERERTPHIIVIMDEAFSDLNVIGDLSTDIEVTPFISSLGKDVISGYALASVYGGNTANSEFEFLTGNSMAWLPANAVPYQQCIRSPTYSIVSFLKTYYDYRCVAMHPYHSDGWDRSNVYAHLGFDEYFFLEDFPQKHYIRKYISDQEMFETIVAAYEQQQDAPLFLFGVSMQNHGGYTYSGENYERSVSLVGYEQHYPDVEQYLSLIHETDSAIEYLLSYFEGVDDDVVVVLFGDHQPKLDDGFLTELARHGSGPMDDQRSKYMIPFFIWANFDIPEKNVECTSLNHLSSYVFEAAGLPLPPYNQFLSEMEEKIPAINANGFYSSVAQCYLRFDEASEEEQVWLRSYERLQYNNLFDTDHRSQSLFPIS